PIALAAMMACRADKLHRDPGIHCVHDRLVEAMQIIGKHADCSLLNGAHRTGLFFGSFLDTGMRGHGIAPFLSCSTLISTSFIPRLAGTGHVPSIRPWRWWMTGRR